MSSDTQTAPPPGERPRRIVKRYSNRKLYDTKDSRYVTLAQIAELVRSGEDVQVIDNSTKEDKTEATLALIISEEVKTTPKAVPLSTLRDLVHQRGEKILSQLREGPIGRLIGSPELTGPDGQPLPAPVPGSPEAAAAAAAAPLPATPATPAPPAVAATSPQEPPSAAGAPSAAPSRTRLQDLVESSKQTIDQWQAAIDERIRAALPAFFRDVQSDVRRLAQRVEELEQKSLAQRVEELEQRVKSIHEQKEGRAEGAPKGEAPPSRTKEG
jgi:polyhydroxyalkanoate synthesis repressor PhaR